MLIVCLVIGGLIAALLVLEFVWITLVCDLRLFFGFIFGYDTVG